MTEAAPVTVETAPAPIIPDTAPAAPVTVTAPTIAIPAPADWRAGLPDDLRANPTLGKYSSVEAAAKALVNATQMIGRDKIPIPREGDDWADWHKAGGRPDTAKDYKFKAPEGLPEGFEYAAEMDEGFREIAHKAGVSQAQAEALRDWYVAASAGQFQSPQVVRDAEIAESTAALEKEWGRAMPQKLQQAESAVHSLFGEEFAQMLTQTGLANNATLIKGMAKLASMTAGDKALIGVMTEHTPGEISGQIADFERTHFKALTDKMNPEHALRVGERTKLYQKRFDTA